MTSRRDFLKLSSLASAAMFTPRFLMGLPQHRPVFEGKRLVVIQLSGGNDGLNTIVPFGDDRYYRLRPRIALPGRDVIPLSDVQGLHPALQPLEAMFKDGHMSILNAVGYPNPNRSHFRSMDIWHSGSDGDTYLDSGWIGRYLDHACAGCQAPHQAIETDDSLSLAMKGEQRTGIAMRKPEVLARSAQDPFFVASANHQPADPGSDLGFLYKTLTGTMQSANYLLEQVKRVPAPLGFPVSDLGRQLALVTQLIQTGAETSVYYVSMTGFDTHVRQGPAHQRLLQQYAEAVAAFREAMVKAGQWEQTLVMTFSEFGRRAEDNAGGGTDHGKANNLWLMGANLRKPGILNPSPDLGKLDDGDLAWQLDFRRVYATLLRDWLAVDDVAVLGQRFEGLGLV